MDDTKINTLKTLYKNKENFGLFYCFHLHFELSKIFFFEFYFQKVCLLLVDLVLRSAIEAPSDCDHWIVRRIQTLCLGSFPLSSPMINLSGI